MSDLISRQAAIDAIRASTSKYTGFMEMEMYTDDDAVEAIESLPSAQPEPIKVSVDHEMTEEELKELKKKIADSPVALLPSAQPEPHWIPCGERLPEERGFYLTTTKDKAVYCDYWNEDNFDRTEMVIAWMPLPEPYEGENQ